MEQAEWDSGRWLHNGGWIYVGKAGVASQERDPAGTEGGWGSLASVASVDAEIDDITSQASDWV
jgi:hypothetical protein